MINRKRITYSSDNKKIKNLSTWIKDCELETYTTKELKEEIKDLLLDVVYDKDKDIREHFFNKYISEFSDILNEQSRQKNLDSLFNVPQEKNEFKLFIENRNRKLENSKKKINANKYDFSENKKINKISNDDDNKNKSEFIIKKEKYNNLKRRDNSKVRDYIKNRNQMMNEYNNSHKNDYDKSNNKSNKSKDNKKNKSLNKEIKRGYYEIPRLLLNKNKKEESKKKENMKNIINYPYNLEDILNKNINYNKNNNISIIKEKKLILNKQNILEEKDLFNQLSRWEELNNKNKQSILNDLFLKETSCNIDEIKKREDFEFIDDSLKDNNDEIKKIKINGFNYKITGDPKKVEIKEEIISDTNNINIEEEKKENEEKSYYHRKIIIKKNLEIDDMPSNGKKENNEEISYIQKIEKDIKASETRIRNINISKDTYKKIRKNLKQLFDNIGVIHINKSYEIRDDKLFEVDNIFDNNNEMQKDFIKKNSHSYEIKKNNLYKRRNKNQDKNNDNIIYEKDLIKKDINKINEVGNIKSNNDINNKKVILIQNSINEEKDKIKKSINSENNENNKTKEVKLNNISETKRKRFHRNINKNDY